MTAARIWMIVALVLAVGSTPLRGHHAFAAYYLEDQSVSIEGTLVEFDYLNPRVDSHRGAQQQRTGAQGQRRVVQSRPPQSAGNRQGYPEARRPSDCDRQPVAESERAADASETDRPPQRRMDLGGPGPAFLERHRRSASGLRPHTAIKHAVYSRVGRRPKVANAASRNRIGPSARRPSVRRSAMNTAVDSSRGL